MWERQREQPRVRFRPGAREEEKAVLKKGERVEELTKKMGQRPRVGLIIDIRRDSVEVRWDDGHVSSVTGALLRPVTKPEEPASR
jgi:hypothetical protein